MQKKLVNIPKLNMSLQDEGAFGSLSGQSQPVCGNVPIPREILDKVQEYFERGNETGVYKKPCIWTAYDSELYANNFDRRSITKGDCISFVNDVLDGSRELSDRALLYKIYSLYKDGGVEGVLKNSEVVDEIKYHIELNSRGIPSKISAIFKAGFRPYTAVFENLSMNIATLLDVPTSYNYIVAFDPNVESEISKQFRISSKKENLQNVGIVSIDFLQNLGVPKHEVEQKSMDGTGWVTATLDYSSDQLSTFANTMRVSNQDDLFLISNWIEGVKSSMDKSMQGFSEKEKKKSLEKIISRTCRSALLRELCGDCDFTPFNAGRVHNDQRHIDTYAPNYDYGECFNGLTSLVFAKDNLDVCGLKPEVFNTLPADVKHKLLSINASTPDSIEKIACKWSSSTGQNNIDYILTNYLNYSKEFFENLEKLMSQGGFDGLVDRYTTMTADGVNPLLSDEEAKATKEYIKIRSNWLMSMYKQKLKNVDNQARQM